MNNHLEFIYIPQDGWLPHLTVKFLIPYKPIASYLLNIHMAEAEVLPWCHHLMRIPQLYKSLQMPIHCPFLGQKYPYQVTPFTIQTAESGVTFTVNGLCYFNETISQCYEGAGWAFSSSSYESTWSFHVHGQGFEIFSQTYFLLTLTMSSWWSHLYPTSIGENSFKMVILETKKWTMA